MICLIRRLQPPGNTSRMPTYKARIIRRILRQKLKCEVEKDGHHIYYRVFDGDRLIGETFMSHNNQDINDYLQDRMAKQLGVSTKVFREIVDCSVNRSDYIELLDDDS